MKKKPINENSVAKKLANDNGANVKQRKPESIANHVPLSEPIRTEIAEDNDRGRLKKSEEGLLIELLEERYGSKAVLDDKFPFLLDLFSLSALKGKDILDIGCGSRDMDGWEPWFCRGACLAGAKPIGIDIGLNYGEEFQIQKKDLLVPGSLDFLKSGQFDIISASHLVFYNPSPTLMNNILGRLNYMDNLELLSLLKKTIPEKMQEYGIEESMLAGDIIRRIFSRTTFADKRKMEAFILRKVIEPEIRSQIKRLLKEDGIFINEAEIFQKRNGELVLLEEYCAELKRPSVYEVL